MVTSGSTASLRAANQRRIVEVLRADASIELSQAEIARATGLAPATVSNIVREMSSTGFLEWQSGAGRRGATVSISRNAGLVAGVDFGHSHLRVALGDLAGNVIATNRRPQSESHRHDEGLALANVLLDELLESAGARRSDLRAVGMGLPAPIGRDGIIDSGSILPGWVGIRAADAATEAFGVPALVDNDANLGGLGESIVGAGANARDMVYLKISSGVGCGLILDHQIYRGGLGTAGEIGHLTMDENGPLCRCGSRGCLEAYVGGDMLISQFEANLGPITLPGLIQLAVNGDHGARRLLEDAGRRLGQAAAILANVIGPELLVFGGDMMAAGDLILDGVRDGIRRHALAPVSAHVQVVVAALGEESSSIGSLLFALEAVELPS